jgi:hypothetical protein
VLIGAALVAGCQHPPEDRPFDARMATLAEAFAARETDPHLAAELFDSAGPGPILEEARFRAWYRTLDGLSADAASWGSFLAAQPPKDLFDRATLAVADALEGEGDREKAVAILSEAPVSIRSSADLRLLDLADDATASRAAHRLARDSPLRLRNHSRSLERAALEEFTPEDWLARAAAWRRLGLGSRGAAEIRNRRFSDDEETARRRELARCELDAGSTTRALNALPSTRRSEAEDHVLRAEAYRRRGWGRFPERSARSSFTSCWSEARNATGSDPEADQAALVLVLECGTESGELDDALSAWRVLEGSGWSNQRRSWLGRRLGVALARDGGHTDGVRGIAAALPEHERCLRFWHAVATPDPEALQKLASAPVEDLYGRWSVELDPTRERRRYTPTRSGGPRLNHRPPSPGCSNTPAVSEASRLSGSGSSVDGLTDPRRGAGGRRAHGHRRTRQHRDPTSPLGLSRDFLDRDRRCSHGRGARLPPAAYTPNHLLAVGDETGLDPWLIAAVARQESTFIARRPLPGRRPKAFSSCCRPPPGRTPGPSVWGNHPNLEDPGINIEASAPGSSPP